MTSGEEKTCVRLVRGVGGVTIVWGAGMAVRGGVLGTAVRSEDELAFSSTKSVRIGGKGGGVSVITV